MNLARQIEKVEFFNSREKSHNSWLRRAADALDVELDDDLLLGNTTSLVVCLVSFKINV